MSDVQRYKKLVRLFNKHNGRAMGGRGGGRYWCDRLTDLLEDLSDIIDENRAELKREGKIK